jgi:DNA-binding XRE family transcriptional regulator
MNKNQNLVKEVCEELGINQTELSKKLEVSQSTISDWNNGKIPKMAKLALQLIIKTNVQEKQLREIGNFYQRLGEISKLY